MTRLREDNRKIHSDYDELQLRFDEEVHSGSAWKREKERLDTKITDLTKAYETSTAVESDQQAQIVSLHSQVRELRNVLNDAEADRAMLQKARRSLQAELEGIKLDHIDATKVTSDRELQKLQLEKQDLERSLEEQEDRVSMAFGRMKTAETHAAESQLELDKIRMENTELDRKNVRKSFFPVETFSLLRCRLSWRSKLRASMSGSWTWKRNRIPACLNRMRLFDGYKLALKNLRLSLAKPPAIRDIAHRFVPPTKWREIFNYSFKRVNAIV